MPEELHQTGQPAPGSRAFWADQQEHSPSSRCRGVGSKSESRWSMKDRGKTVTKPGPLSPLGLALSEKQIPQVIEKPESGDKRKEALERVVMRPRQVRYQAALRPDI
jgi:hypothetical protein